MSFVDPPSTLSVQQSQVNTKQHKSSTRVERDKYNNLRLGAHTEWPAAHTWSDQLHEKEQEIQQHKQQFLGLQNLVTATNDQMETLLQNRDEQPILATLLATFYHGSTWLWHRPLRKEALTQTGQPLCMMLKSVRRPQLHSMTIYGKHIKLYSVQQRR